MANQNAANQLAATNRNALAYRQGLSGYNQLNAQQAYGQLEGINKTGLQNQMAKNELTTSAAKNQLVDATTLVAAQENAAKANAATYGQQMDMREVIMNEGERRRQAQIELSQLYTALANTKNIDDLKRIQRVIDLYESTGLGLINSSSAVLAGIGK
jgi:hypothetical protein